ncbi:hypothetical protein [Carbonactinospora thermoautotrophica]|uniref:hypothetical protein n=1 Tax=Carbonactinospora thermoautotrophica TaxID=1469144 RepID=UPI000A85F8C4|nr:hypothetical protein [Carbonactinospora thermoautotrophica]
MEEASARLKKLLAQGEHAPLKLVARANFPIGIDDQFRPFPVDPSGDGAQDRVVKPPGDGVEDLSW